MGQLVPCPKCGAEAGKPCRWAGGDFTMVEHAERSGELLKVPMVMVPRPILIPTAIHRIWLGGKPMPEQFSWWGKTWDIQHPGWIRIDWTEEALPRLDAWPLLQALLPKCGTLSQQSNLVRYAVLHQFGGVYVDTDFECLKNLSPLLAEARLVSAWQSRNLAEPGAIANGFIAAVPRHPLFAELLAGAPALDLGRPRAAGPEYFTYAIFGQPGSSTVGYLHDARILERRLFYPYDWNELHRSKEVFLEAYAVHHWAGKWHAPSTERLI